MASLAAWLVWFCNMQIAVLHCLTCSCHVISWQIPAAVVREAAVVLMMHAKAGLLFSLLDPVMRSNECVQLFNHACAKQATIIVDMEQLKGSSAQLSVSR